MGFARDTLATRSRHARDTSVPPRDGRTALCPGVITQKTPNGMTPEEWQGALAEYARIDIDAHCESHAASREVVEQANAESRGLSMDELELIRAGRAARLAFPDNLPDPAGGGSGALENAHTMAEQNVAGRWLTAEYRMGDVLLFSIYTMHGSTDMFIHGHIDTYIYV